MTALRAAGKVSLLVVIITMVTSLIQIFGKNRCIEIEVIIPGIGVTRPCCRDRVTLKLEGIAQVLLPTTLFGKFIAN
jgi:hypothetical protein